MIVIFCAILWIPDLMRDEILTAAKGYIPSLKHDKN